MQSIYHLADKVIDLFIRFCKAFFSLFGRLYTSCSEIGKTFPHTLYSARKFLGINKKHFRQYVVCKRCYNIYDLSACIEVRGSQQIPKDCPHVPFGVRQPRCNTKLLKTVELASGTKIFSPLKTYCYMDLHTSVQNLLLRAGFLETCNEWRNRTPAENSLSEVYDGNIWKQFTDNNFLTDKCSLALMLNCDWFQPYKHLQYSVGALYLSVLNLPGPVRNKIHNICLVGILPGPHEPSHDINSFIDPLVADLCQFWNGVELTVKGSGKKKIRCAVLLVSCDIPAGRKLCGFLSYSARLGCSRCYKSFPGSVGNMDYSGFNRESWHPRTQMKHRQDVETIMALNTKTERKRTESMLGCRYSSLLKLSYFDPVVMLAIDPMHNLFLGIAKHHLQKIWIASGLIKDTDFCVVQDRIDRFLSPPDIGRIPTKIQSGFSSFTAEQFKNWVIHYSIIALRGLLSNEHLECWRHFVHACRILCLKTVTRDQIKLADAFLLQYCKRVERIYGKDVITPNMHLSCHLSSCVLDYGPLQNFWLFAFERFNGLLGKLPNSNRSIEVQMMRRFQYDADSMSLSTPDLFHEELKHLIPASKPGPNLPCDTTSTSVNSWTYEDIASKVSLPKLCTLGFFASFEVEQLQNLYSRMYQVPESHIEVCSSFKKYRTVTIGGILLGSHKSRSRSSSIVIAEWNVKLLGMEPKYGESNEKRPVRINYFIKHTALVGTTPHTHVLVHVSWFNCHPLKVTCGKPVTVWEHNIFELHNVIPIQLLCSRTVSLIDKLSESHGHALLVSPLLDDL